MTASAWLELLWTTIALVGALIQSWLLIDALESRRLAKADPRGNERRGRMIRGHIREATGYLFVHLVFAFVGIRSLLIVDLPLTPGRIITITLFMAASAGLVWLGWGARRDRLFIRSHPVGGTRRTP